MKKILIVGGCGYVGARLYQYLSQEHEVESLDSEKFGKPSFINNYKYEYHKISWDPSFYDVIILLAARASVSLCKDSYKVLERDVNGFCRLFENISLVSGKKRIKFIFASTGSIYGKNGLLCKEDNLPNIALNPYDLCKRFNEEYALLNKEKVEFYGLRFGTVNGWSPHLRTDIMINSMYRSSQEKGFICCSCPEQYRGLLDIEDLCSSIKEIILNDDDKRGIFNLSSLQIKEFVLDKFS